MKRIAIMGLILLGVISLCGQSTSNSRGLHFIEPLEIFVGYKTTTSLIFPFSIKSVDRGIPALLVQKAKAVDNILQLKAGRKEFAETNLSVVTADGTFYCFVVKFSSDSADLAIRVGDSVSAVFDKDVQNEASLQQQAYAVKVQPAKRLKKVCRYDLGLSLSGLFFTTETVWLKLDIRNGSPLDLRPMRMRFFLRDSKRASRTAIQEKQIEPVYTDLPPVVPYYSCGQTMVGFPAFVIPEGKKLVIQMAEDENGRLMEMTVKPRTWRQGKRL